ncbi:MAG TPA: hemerythrin domain-containing protein [Anaerolineae bacterium]|nr:hemerythrin domain-containing protein [Anaerolineae bacterium]
MGHVGEAIRNHHQELVEVLKEKVAAMVEERPEADPQSLAAFLQKELLPHASGEERHLYPRVEPLLRDHGRATATMSVDHEFIEDYVRRIAGAAAALQSAGEGERSALESHLRRLALQLEAVLLLHLEKEERVYLPLFEEHLSDTEQERVLDGMHAAYDTPGGS